VTGRRAKPGGFTLIEVIVVIAVVSILASMAVPYVVKILDQAREESTRKQMQELYQAILGDPGGPTAGYLGDMGTLPASLALLNTQGSQRAPTYGTLGVKYGWSGPYAKIGFSQGAYLVDGWGTNLAYNNPGAGQIRSAGPDRNLGTADDIVYPPSAVVPAGSLTVNLNVWRTDNTTSQYVLNPRMGSFPGMQANVQLFYSVNGQASAPPLSKGTSSGGDPPYTLGPVHAGFHEVFATCTLPPNPATSGQAVVYVPGNNQQTVLNLYLR
jgi:prepilin-type N-terminal cleavage/methylation domain-containing protein